MKTSVKDMPGLSNWQWAALITLRVLIGWHMLYEGLVKIIDPYWSSAAYLKQSTWIFTDLFHAIAESTFWLSFVDILNPWALCMIGIALIAGLFTKPAGIVGSVLLLIYYLANPPLFSQDAMIATNGQTIIVNKLLIEAAALFAVSLFPTGRIIGIDHLIVTFKSKRDL
jgi:thiosulfate dehydrogenase [quinone] large subunit